MSLRITSLLAVLLLVGAGCDTTSTIARPSGSAELVKPIYRTYSADGYDVRLVLTRPDSADRNVQLAVPGTYTTPDDKVGGFVVLDGKIIQSAERQAWDGAIVFSKGKFEIVQTNNGKLLTKDFLNAVAKGGKSLIQGHLLVKEGKAQSFKEQPFFQRRALVHFKDGSAAVIESVTWTDLNGFADDLVELGVNDAMNLDMGQWSEGWYRDEETREVVTIGDLRGETERQTNWIIFAKSSLDRSEKKE